MNLALFRRIFVALVVFLLTVPCGAEEPAPSEDQAQKDQAIEACFSAYEETQVRLKARQFEKARELARSCSSGCPKEIATQCQTWAWEAERDAPSVLLVARRESGEDAEGVTASIDGQWKPLQKEVLLDPGPHTIKFSREDGWEHVVEVTIHPGEKRRTIRATVFEETKPEPKNQVEAPRKSKKHVPWAIAAFSVGASGFAVAGAFTIVALDQKSFLENCAPNCQEADVKRARDALLIADVGLVVGAVGAVTGIGILLWGKPGPARGAQMGVSASGGDVSAVLRGRF